MRSNLKKGRLKAMRAILDAPDLRLIFQESNGYALVFFLMWVNITVSINNFF